MSIVNAVRCLMCGEVLVSRRRHDFQICSCPNRTFVDGGGSYMRAGGVELGMIQFLDPSGQKFPNADDYVQPRLLEV